MKTIASLFLSILLTVAFLHPMPADDEPIRLPDVIGGSGITSRSIHIKGSPQSLLRTASKLFELHGGFRLTDENPDFTFSFTQPSTNTTELRITSAGTELLRQSVSASSPDRSLYKAADLAVRRTLGLPGFFDSRLAFISDRTGHAEVYTADLLFNATRQLTRDRAQCLSPNLSPDGQILLYTSYHGNGFPDIYRVDLASGQRSLFAGFQGTNTGANFSPDGARVAMVLSGSGNSEIYLADPNGANLRRLTRERSLETGPSWSPDGRRLAFTSDRMGKPQIYVMDVTGQSTSRVRTDISRHCSEPAWNPRDPDQIAFTAAMAGAFEVAIYRFSEDESTIVTRGSGDAVHPAWMADGRHLIYTQRTASFSRLMLLDTRTGTRRVLSPAELNSAREASPVLLP